MSGDVTYQALDRLTFLSTRDALKNGNVIAGQPYDDIYVIGGYIANVTLDNVAIVGPIRTYLYERFVSSGTTDTAPNVNTFIGWQSATTGAKTQTIPASTGSKGIIIVNDMQGTAYNYPITIVPVSGSINGGQNQVYTNYGSLTLLDTSQGWVAT